MKIAIVGSKGIPANYGGYETFAEKVSHIFKGNNKVLVIGDGTNKYGYSQYEGIDIINSKYIKSNNPIKFYHDSLRKAELWGADLAIMCGIGGVFSVPLFTFSKMKIAVNPDGLGFRRAKWVWWKKIALLVQFIFGALFVKYIICDSIGIKNYFKRKLNRSKNVFVAEYGAKLFVYDYQDVDAKFFLNKAGLVSDGYYLVVSRLEPENNVEMIIKGYLNSAQNYPIIVVGNTNTQHAKKLMELSSENVRFIGGVYDKNQLSSLRLNCRAYLHGHSVGGTNPSLLEAMGSGNLTIAHNNEFNREVLSDMGYFFSTDREVAEILKAIESPENQSRNQNFIVSNRQRIESYYTWEKIANKYLKIANQIV